MADMASVILIGHRLRGGSVMASRSTGRNEGFDDDQIRDLVGHLKSRGWKGGFGELVRGARRTVKGVRLVVISFRMPREQEKRVEQAVERTGITKSEFYRLATDRMLRLINGGLDEKGEEGR